MSKQEDRKFLKSFLGVIVALVGLTIALIILATLTGSPTESELEAREALNRERVEQRLQPVAAVRLSGEPMPEVVQAQQAPAESGGGEPKSAEQIVQSVCASCHGAGVLGAPKVGDKAAWEERLEQGLDTVVNYAINGIRAMPPRGGDPSLSDEEVRSAVVYMIEESGISVE